MYIYIWKIKLKHYYFSFLGHTPIMCFVRLQKRCTEKAMKGQEFPKLAMYSSLQTEGNTEESAHIFSNTSAFPPQNPVSSHPDLTWLVQLICSQGSLPLLKGGFVVNHLKQSCFKGKSWWNHQTAAIWKGKSMISRWSSSLPFVCTYVSP